MKSHSRKIPSKTALIAAAASLILIAVGWRLSLQKENADEPAPVVSAQAGRLPVNQIVTPAGLQVDLPDMRPHVLALSPDGTLLAVSGRTHDLVLVDPAAGLVKQRVPLPPDPPNATSPPDSSGNILKPDEKGQASCAGLAFAPDGRRIYLGNVNGSIKVFGVGPDGRGAPLFAFSLPPANAPRREEEIPAGIAPSADGKKLYIALNLSNRLGEFDAADGRLLRLIDVGVAPFDVVLAGGRAFVSNWGGRRPGPGDPTGPAGRGTLVKVDPVRFIADEGSVSIVDLEAWRVVSEPLVQLHASALAVSPDRRHVVCANAASDTLSVIDVRSGTVVETISAKPSPADLFGASPNALAFDDKGRYLYAANGTQNAVAVIEFKPDQSASRLIGLMPTGWWPGALAFDAARGRLCVANFKGLAGKKILDKRTGGMGFNSHQYRGSLSLIPVPAADLPALTRTVWTNYFGERIASALLPPRAGRPARPVPERSGEPSVFKHVIYVIKENRTYDQVLGDVREGRGDPSLTMFGEEITPNQHKMVKEFVLLDNTYCNSILSADGHQWSMTAFATDYMEKNFGGWPRSYPDGMGDDEADALAYAPTGFIWDNALAHGKTLRDYGEFAKSAMRWADPRGRKEGPGWMDCWREINAPRGQIVFGCVAVIDSLKPHLASQTVGWDMDVPDQYRADVFIKELGAFERQGTFPDLTIVCLPNDHTNGTKEGLQSPGACAADNDLAFGRIVEAVSKSRFWKDTVIFGIEDDPQDGWDHVSGFRTTAYVVSPYAKRGRTIGAFYNTVSLLRTIEQILGLPPLNQFDAAAVPMRECFTEEPDFTPFRAVPARLRLDTLNPPPAEIKDKTLRREAALSARLDFSRPDACPEDTLNRILWHAMKGSGAPYPLWAVSSRGAAGADDD